MRRRAYIIGIVVMGLTATAVRTTPAYSRLASSARCFQAYVRGLHETGNTLSPIERIVFSLILQDNNSSGGEKAGVSPEHHS